MPSGSRNNGTPSRRVWLHVGMPKTGSTALQNSLYRNRGALLSHGILYPDLGAPQHVALARMLAGKAASPIRFPNTGSCPPCDTIDQLIEGTASDVHTVIISSENFYQRPACNPGHATLPKAEAFDTLRRTVEATRDFLQGADVQVVMWLRRQDNWLMSMYQETVKTSSYHDDIWTYAEHTIGTYIYEIVSIWIEAFGRNRVSCLDYEAVRAAEGDIVAEFSEILNLEPKILCSRPRPKDRRDNAGLVRRDLELKLFINRRLHAHSAGADVVADVNRTFRKLCNIEPPKRTPWPHALLSPGERLELLERFATGNELLCGKHGYTHLRRLFATRDLSDRPDVEAWRPWGKAVNQEELSDILLALNTAQTERILRLEAELDALKQMIKQRSAG